MDLIECKLKLTAYITRRYLSDVSLIHASYVGFQPSKPINCDPLSIDAIRLTVVAISNRQSSGRGEHLDSAGLFVLASVNVISIQ